MKTLAGAALETQRPRSALGFDFGTSRIGIAYGLLPGAAGVDLCGSARALCVLKAAAGVPDWTRIAALIHEWQPDCMVVGLPYNIDGSDGELLPRVLKFGHRLHGRFNLPVYGMDERLSSRAAMDELADLAETLGKSGKRNRSRKPGKTRKPGQAIDDVAAKLILETWFRELP